MLRFLLLLISLVLVSASSADTLRCGSRVIAKGAYKPEVLHKCGEPDVVEAFLLYDTVILNSDTQKNEVHTHRAPIHGTQGGYKLPVGHKLLATPVEAEDWSYNFGPNRLMRRLRFINGKLDKIETVGYGY